MGLRIGHGWDAHPLVPGRPCVLGGVEVPSETGPGGHSDGDVLLHALADALLGASARGDLGSVFGTSDPCFEAAASEIFVREALHRAGFPQVLSVDVTVVASRPELAPFRDAMRENIARIVGVKADLVSVKFCTGNGLTEFGRGEGVSATAVVLVSLAETQ